eukprot:3337325-Rhodomonas_salina.1
MLSVMLDLKVWEGTDDAETRSKWRQALYIVLLSVSALCQLVCLSRASQRQVPTAHTSHAKHALQRPELELPDLAFRWRA